MTNVGGLFPRGLIIDRGMVRETARATADLVKRQSNNVTVLGATVTAAVPGSGVVSVHLDGDPPGQSVQVSSASWELYDVGQRVLIELAPPSFAVLLGPVGPAAVWTPYGTGTLPDTSVWQTNDQNVPVVTNIAANSAALAGGNSLVANGVTTFNLAANRLILVSVGVQQPMELSESPTGTTTVDSITNTGVPLQWTQVGQLATPLLTVALFRAYNVSAQTGIQITANFSGQLGSGSLTVLAQISVQSVTNAMPVQTSAAVTSGSGTTAVDTTLTTTDDHSTVLSVVAYRGSEGDICLGGPCDDGTVVAVGPSAIIQKYDSTNTPNGPSPARVSVGLITANRATTTVGSTTVDLTLTKFATGGMQTRRIGVEILGTPNNPVIGDGTMGGFYRLRGKSMDLRIAIAAGAATTFGSGQYKLALPPGFVLSPRPPNGMQCLAGTMRPAGTNTYRIIAEGAAGAAFFDKVAYADAGTTYWSPSNPVAATSGLRLALNGTVEVA